MTAPPTAADEGLQEPGPEEQWSDSFYFGGGDAETTLYTRIGRRPNEDAVEGALGIWAPDGRFVLGFGRTPDRAELAAGPVAYECALPFELWRLEIDGSRPRLRARRGPRARAGPLRGGEPRR